ncbi:S24 family peptidase [Ruixingdingia sedimenti]|uniref:S24 family peptidase n=1 Tax=Ruixingdingia sedimenti TaxID=3073604 RepID=A0ABU1FD27_9RHOB|nr:S24 family peptidase [Xinfangfangia sp. LG-4]MDR5654785.1 S24 family peptidase [Xinfangfangia sp. LG-4]
MALVNPNLDEPRLRARVAAAISAGGGVAQMVKRTGIPKGTLEKYAAQTSTASFANAAKIAAGAGLTLDQIAFAQEDISKSGAKTHLREMLTRMGQQAREYRPSSGHRTSDAFIHLPFYPEVTASAGPGALAVSEQSDSVIAFARSFLRDHGAVPDRCSIIRAKGDSMAPTIPDASLLIVDHSQAEIANGCIMVVSVGDDLLVKRVRRRLDGQIDLISDNPAYPPETLQPAALQQLRVVGRVVYFCRTP